MEDELTVDIGEDVKKGNDAIATEVDSAALCEGIKEEYQAGLSLLEHHRK